MKTQEKKHKVQRINKKINDSLSYTVEVRDKDGRVLQRISAPSRSYVEQWNKILRVQVSTSAGTIRDTGGINRSVGSYTWSLQGTTSAGETSWGIRVGKGDTAVAITDYALESPCAQGTGTDEFGHWASVVTLPSVVGSTCSFTIRRNMVNNSGATITIKEIGCYVRMKTYYGLGFRDVLPSAVDVPDGGAITITYTLAVTV